jgi:AI-2 transport protein TqsA
MAANPLSPPIAPSESQDPEEKDPLALGAADIEAFEEAVASDEQARADLHVQTICLLILAFVAGGVALYWLRPVLVPFVLALFFAACLKPLIEFQKRKLHFPQWLAVAGAVILAATVILSIGVPIGVSINNMKPGFQQQFDQFLDRAARVVPLERFGIKPSVPAPEPETVPALPAHPWADGLTSYLFSAVGSAVGEVTGLASATLLVIIFSLFILLGRRGEQQQEPSGLLAEIEIRVQRYINQMVLLSAVTGIGVCIVLRGCGVKYAVVFGFLAFLLNFIPTVGSLVATLLPLPIILLSPEMGPWAKTLALVLPAAMQIYLGYAVQPRILGNALDLHPIVILISLIFWGMIWGLPGAFLATPITAVLRIVLEKIPATRPVAELLAGRLSAVF